MQKIKSTTTGIILLLALAGLLAATPLASAQSTGGSFNPQTQFPIGSTVTVQSVYGLGGGIPFFNQGMMGGMKGNWTKGNWSNGNQSHSWTQNNQSRTRNWNQTGPPSFNASLTLTAQVTNDTANGDILWTIKSGSIIENGTTLTITSGMGGIGKLDRILMGGNATDSNGHTYRWALEGLATMYNGTIIASLNGGSNYNPNPATPTTQQQPSQTNNPETYTTVNFIATIT
ncbi:MAG: hypothetical protein ABSA92_08010 [Candidatus Bathyarchaeia archaeon]|jgi:hypothetical protein